MPRALRSGIGVGLNEGRGVVVMDWSANSSLQNQAGTAELVTASDGPTGLGVTKYLRLTQNATASFGQCDRSLNVGNLPFVPIVSVGLWARNPTKRVLSFELQIFENGAARSLRCNFACRPTGNQWIFLTAPVNNFLSNTIVSPDAYRFVRATQTAVDFNAWDAGNVLDIGPVHLNARARPKFMIITDDSRTGNVVNGGGFPTGYPASGGNFLSIVSAYGFKGSASIITSLVGTGGGNMTWDQIATLADAGWAIINHGTIDHQGSGSQGMTYLSSAEMTADILAAASELRRRGYAATANFFALPQGAWNTDLMFAAQAAGVQCTIGIGNTTLAGRAGTVAVGGPSGGGHINVAGPTLYPGWPDIASRVQIDGTPVLADVQTYIDDLIAIGGTGGCYMHNINATIATLCDGMCQHLRLRQRQGLIDVVTVAQWYAQRYGSRAFG